MFAETRFLKMYTFLVNRKKSWSNISKNNTQQHNSYFHFELYKFTLFNYVFPESKMTTFNVSTTAYQLLQETKMWTFQKLQVGTVELFSNFLSCNRCLKFRPIWNNWKRLMINIEMKIVRVSVFSLTRLPSCKHTGLNWCQVQPKVP